MKDMILQFIQFLKFSRILSLSFIINADLLIMEFNASLISYLNVVVMLVNFKIIKIFRYLKIKVVKNLLIKT